MSRPRRVTVNGITYSARPTGNLAGEYAVTRPGRPGEEDGLVEVGMLQRDGRDWLYRTASANPDTLDTPEGWELAESHSIDVVIGLLAIEDQAIDGRVPPAL